MHHQNHIFFQQDTQPLLRLMAHVSLLILPLLLRRLASVQNLPNMSYTRQGGKIPQFFILLIGRQELGPAYTHLLVNISQSLNLNLHCLLPCLADTGWEKQLTIGVQDARGSRKHSPMCSVPTWLQYSRNSLDLGYFYHQESIYMPLHCCNSW